MERLGEIAAFGTALCWTISALFFEGASKKIGPLAVNFYKVFAAFFLLGLAGFALRGMPFPFDAPVRAWIFLPISGIIGFVIADYFLFNAYVLISSRLTVLFQALTPLFAGLFGFLILGENMRLERIFAMILVIAGILIVVTSRNSLFKRVAGAPSPRQTAPRNGSAIKGYVFAFLSSVFQALGLIFSKLGLGGYDAISGIQIRVMTGILGFALQALIIGQGATLFNALKDRGSMKKTAIGSIFGPFLGVTLSLFALQNTDAGAASTLMALTPILIIPPSILFLKQKVKPLEILGAAVAVGGAALFFAL